jgi:hypothetical protein
MRLLLCTQKSARAHFFAENTQRIRKVASKLLGLVQQRTKAVNLDKIDSAPKRFNGFDERPAGSQLQVHQEQVRAEKGMGSGDFAAYALDPGSWRQTGLRTNHEEIEERRKAVAALLVQLTVAALDIDGGKQQTDRCTDDDQPNQTALG